MPRQVLVLAKTNLYQSCIAVHEYVGALCKTRIEGSLRPLAGRCGAGEDVALSWGSRLCVGFGGGGGGGGLKKQARFKVRGLLASLVAGPCVQGE